MRTSQGVLSLLWGPLKESQLEMASRLFSPLRLNIFIGQPVHADDANKTIRHQDINAQYTGSSLASSPVLRMQASDADSLFRHGNRRLLLCFLPKHLRRLGQQLPPLDVHLRIGGRGFVCLSGQLQMDVFRGGNGVNVLCEQSSTQALAQGSAKKHPELSTYCYRRLDRVGLTCMHIRDLGGTRGKYCIAGRCLE